MMDGLVLHPATRNQLERFAAQPSHALLLCGPAGAGKTALARGLAASLLQSTPDAFERYPYKTLIAPDDKGTISIASIRELQHFLQLRTTGTIELRRAVIVEQADAMTTEAQNAFLKLLEEPPADTLILLTAANLRALLPTIRSRVQHLTVREPEEAALKSFFTEQGSDASRVTQAYLLSGGLPGLMHALLNDDNEHPLMASVLQAKQLLAGQPFGRLCAVDALSKQKGDAVLLLDALLSIARAGLQQAAAKRDNARIRQWHRIRKQALHAREALQQSANTKLVLTNLMLQI
jgi:DNA polymerase-3 subunit delta'